MTDATGSVWLVTALVIGVEYAVKQGYEGLPSLQTGMATARYARFRAFAAGLLLVVLCVVFRPVSHAVGLTFLAALGAATELPLARLQSAAYLRWGLRLRWLQLGPLAALAWASLVAGPWLDLAPWTQAFLRSFAGMAGVDPATASAILATYVLLAQPANHVIRVLLDKETDRLLPELVLRVRVACTRGAPGHPRPILAPEAAPATETASALDTPPAAPAAPRTNIARAAQTACAPAETTSAAEPEAESEPHESRRETVPGASTDWQTLRAGRVIGILERWLVLTLVLASQFALVGLVLTAKSIARFRQLEEADFAEYYLLGTLYSLLFALLAGLGLRAAIG